MADTLTESSSTAPASRPRPARAATELGWSVEESASLYSIRNWGKGFFDVNAAGHVVVRPTRNPAVEVDLYEVVAGMRERGFGRVVMISSRGALGLATRSAYAATKAGMIGLARTWALELAPEGITVNVVAPGPIRGTEMFHAVVPAESERERQLAAAIPVKRLGTPEEIGSIVGWLAGDESGFTTGADFSCNGGLHMG